MTPDLAPSLLPTLRARYGFSQAQLAEYLGVSRALVAMAEQGRRTFSGAAWARLQPLLETLSAPNPASALPLDPLTRAALQHRLGACTQEAAQLRQELTQLHAAAAQHQAVLQHLLPHLRPLASVAEPQQAWLRQREQEATRQLARTGPAVQVLLELRIEALDYEASQAALRLARAGSL